MTVNETEKEPESFKASITITAKKKGEGLLVSMKLEGQFSDEMLERRFYSISGMPPKDLEPRLFWRVLLGDISQFLTRD